MWHGRSGKLEKYATLDPRFAHLFYLAYLGHSALGASADLPAALACDFTPNRTPGRWHTTKTRRRQERTLLHFPKKSRTSLCNSGLGKTVF
jgi:ketosteroid isomerase-like protein